MLTASDALISYTTFFREKAGLTDKTTGPVKDLRREKEIVAMKFYLELQQAAQRDWPLVPPRQCTKQRTV